MEGELRIDVPRLSTPDETFERYNLDAVNREMCSNGL